MPNTDHDASPPPSREFLWNSLTYGLLPDEQEQEDANAPLDLTSILGLGTDDFIQQLYVLALNRHPDSQAIEHWRLALLNGMKREAIIFMICTSHEFGGRRPVAHLDAYRKVYEKYRMRESIKRIPVIRWLWAFAGMPRKLTATLHRMLAVQAQMDKLITEQSRSLQNVFTEIRLLSSQLSALQAQQNALQTQQISLQAQLEIANQNTINAHTKLDATGLAILNTVDQNKPFIYGLSGGVTVVRTKEYIIGVPSEEWRLAVFLSQYGSLEIGTEKYFRSILKQGMNVLDVGAHVGIYTLHALAAGCNVYSYEPTPRLFDILLDNIEINGFQPTGRANAYNLAVSNTEGKAEFSLSGKGYGQNNSLFAIDNSKRIEVNTTYLDEHLSHLDHIDVVKIDVEGAEPLVLAGMQNIIARNPHLKIIMEFVPSHIRRAGKTPSEFIRQIRSMGLGIHIIDPSSGEILETNDQDLCEVFSVNLLLEKSGEIKEIEVEG